LPVPQVKKGKWSKERERTKSGRWRKKRSDADQPKKPKRSTRKYVLALAVIVVIVVVLVVLYFLFPEWLTGLKSNAAALGSALTHCRLKRDYLGSEQRSMSESDKQGSQEILTKNLCCELV